MTSTSKYAYRSIRSGGKVERTYLGTRDDPVVQVLQEFSRLQRATAEAEESQVAHDLEILAAVEGCLRLLGSLAGRRVRNIRKRFRRANGIRIRRCDLGRVKTTRDEYDSLVEGAADGDADALAALRQVLTADSALCEPLGDLNGHVQRHLIELAAGDSVDVRESLQIMLSKKREELLADGDSVPEQMLVDQVLSTMLDAACCQLGLSQPHDKESVTRRWEHRLTRAQARHQTAIWSLVEIRQMLEDTSEDTTPDKEG